MLERVVIYATDASELAVAAARGGTFEVESREDLLAAHQQSGGTAPIADLGEFEERSFSFKNEFKRHIIVAKHDLVTDGSLNEFHVILARGVLRHFNRALQFRVHNLFLSSLVRLGFLCLGSSESLRLTPHEGVFRQSADDAPIYRRMR